MPKVSADNVLHVVKEWKEQVVSVQSCDGRHMGIIAVDLEKAEYNIGKTGQLEVNIINGAVGDMDQYFFLIPHVNVVVSFRKKTEEELMNDVLDAVKKLVMEPMHHTKTSSEKKYYHCKCCNNMAAAETRNAINTYPSLDAFGNVLAHKKAVYDYFRNTPEEKQIAGKIAGFVASYLSRYFAVAYSIPTGFVTQLKEKISDIGIVDYPEHAMITDDEIILAVEEYNVRNGKRWLYSTASFIVQRQSDDSFKRVTLNKSRAYNFWKELVGI